MAQALLDSVKDGDSSQSSTTLFCFNTTMGIHGFSRSLSCVAKSGVFTLL